LVNFYIGRRGWQALAGAPGARAVFLTVFLCFVLAYPAARFAAALGRNSLSGLLAKAGSFHLALMLYLFLGVLVVDIFRLANAIRPFFPKSFSARPHQTGLAVFLIVVAGSLLVIAGGALNAARPRLRELAIPVDKPAGGRTALTVVMASDVHLGMVAGSSRLRRLVERINALAPDIVLLPGDIVDESVTEREEEEMTAVFQGLKAPLGVYSVPGNHEYYGGLERNLAHLREWGVRVLQDEAILVDGSFYVIGRKDPSSARGGAARKPLEEILESGRVDRRLPLLLMDHQPIHLEQAEQAGIDLELAGHTHAGQLFPLNLINKLVYERNWGSLVKGKTRYYVSCGVGTWGPPVRTGSVPEIVRIHLTFKGTR
jgi:predicted MPP superfamily phosphohydrolase